MKREDRIQQIKDCGQSIVDHAESIYGDYPCSTSLTVVIAMDVNKPPVITVNREFYSEIMLERAMGGETNGKAAKCPNKSPC